MKKKLNIKKTTQILRSHKLVTFLIALALVGVGSICFSILAKDNDEVHDTINVVKGKVTKKRTSCGLEVLSKEGTVQQEPGVCDGGNYLTVNNITISTGGGSLGGGHGYPYYITNIDNVHAGDSVEIGYVIDEKGGETTNCETCYLKKTGSATNESQQIIQKSPFKTHVLK